MALIPDSFLDDLLARTDLVELIAARVPLKRAGREYQGRCPFHDERTPSFTVSPTKQFYHCFGCGAHGSAIKFLMEYDRLEFLDAVEELARRAGVEVPRETRRNDAQRAQLQPLYDTCEEAARWFRGRLAADARAQQYLARRGVDAATAERYGLGYAPAGWDGLRNALGHTPDAIARLDKVGLLSKNDSGHVYDKFRDRLVFPIHDRRGRVIAFGGRVLEKDDSPKYLNSPETPLFHKGRELYGLWQVRQAHSRIPHIVVVEGYMDVVSLAQFGVTTAVATLGTATTPDHAELLFRNAADVYFCFDGDRAGRAAAWRALESALPRLRDGRQAYFLFLPEGDDPDTLVRREGAAGFESQLKKATPLGEFLFAELERDIRLDSLDGRARLAERAKPLLAQIPDGAFRDLMQQHLAQRTGLQTASAASSATPAPSPPPRRTTAAPRRSLVRTAIALLVQKPDLAAQIAQPYPFAALEQPGMPLLLELLALVAQRPGIVSAGLLEHFAGREEEAALRKLLLTDLLADPDTWQAEFDGALQQLTRMTRTQQLDRLLARQRDGGLDPAEKDQLRELLMLRARGGA